MDTTIALTTHSVLSNKQCRENRARFWEKIDFSDSDTAAHVLCLMSFPFLSTRLSMLQVKKMLLLIIFTAISITIKQDRSEFNCFNASSFRRLALEASKCTSFPAFSLLPVKRELSASLGQQYIKVPPYCHNSSEDCFLATLLQKESKQVHVQPSIKCITDHRLCVPLGWCSAIRQHDSSAQTGLPIILEGQGCPRSEFSHP